jgi:phosphatidylserine decarboxylase
MKTILQKVTDTLFLLPLALLPHHALSRLVHAVARSTNPLLSQTLIRTLCNSYSIDLSLAAEPDPQRYPSLNHFFTRALKAGARPIADGAGVVVSPVDGAISQCGPIHGNTLIQAKGHQFDLTALLGGLESRARPFTAGTFATLYLSPRDYHRIHMPLEGRLREMVYIPGRLYPVNNPSTRTVPGLFARNERVAVLFETSAGPMAMVLVGALFVGSIETVWAGEITPPNGSVVHCWRYQGEEAITLKQGEEMGRFNMGSTVILLFGAEAVALTTELRGGTLLKMGESIGQHSGAE